LQADLPGPAADLKAEKFRDADKEPYPQVLCLEYTAAVNEMPPSYRPQQKDKSKTTLIVVIVLVCVLVPCLCIVGGGAFAYFFAKKNVMPMMGCSLTMKFGRDAIVRYTQENGGRFPDAKTWQADVKPFYADLVKSGEPSRQLGAKTPDELWTCRPGLGGGETGIAYNSDLSGKNISEFKDPFSTIVLFEVEKPAQNCSEKYKVRPDSGSPAMFGEHLGWFYVMLQGEADLTGSGKGMYKSNAAGK
jgi:hypothetical protein